MESFVQGDNALPDYAPRDSVEFDFNDVFGGPPRRFSMQEVRSRYSFGDTDESEKPVFGGETTPRRRHHAGDDFFGDIFKGGDSHSSPKWSDRDSANPFGSSPRLFSPKVEPLGTSVPSQFSLPAKLTKIMESPTFASRNYSQYKTDGSWTGLNSPQSPSASLSRFSNQAIRGQDEIRKKVQPVYLQSSLSREPSIGHEDSPSPGKFDPKNNVGNLKKDTKVGDSIGNQFHFSIYKWAGGGVPMLIPLAGRRKAVGRKDRSMESDYMENKPSTVTNEDWLAHMEPASVKIDGEKKVSMSKEEITEIQSSIKEVFINVSQSKSQNSAEDGAFYGGTRQKIEAEQVKSLDEIDTREEIGKQVRPKIEESFKSEVRPLRAFLHNEIEQAGNVTKRKENKTSADTNASKNMRKTEIDSIVEKLDKCRSQGAGINSGATTGKSRTKGKVREFVQIFNQEADSRHKADAETQNLSSRWKAVDIDQKENQVAKNLYKDEVQEVTGSKIPVFQTDHLSNNQEDAYSSDSLQRDSKISMENSDDPLEDIFLVQELPDDLETDTQSGEGSNDLKVLDAKIREWSIGKKGNIRSLLSTLQYVLWPESGWKPVPLVDLIEANSVKRAYQKALLRLHPDKLQQKGAAFHQKYTAEKVFDILQEAWDHFNTLTPL